MRTTARVLALGRRARPGPPPVLRRAGITLDPARREVTRDGRYVLLSRKEFAVLAELLRADGAVVSAEHLLEKAWDEHVDPFTGAVRLTVVYGGLFFLAGLTLLGVTFLLFQQQLSTYSGKAHDNRTADGRAPRVIIVEKNTVLTGDAADAWLRRQQAEIHAAATTSLLTQGFGPRSPSTAPWSNWPCTAAPRRRTSSGSGPSTRSPNSPLWTLPTSWSTWSPRPRRRPTRQAS